VATTMIYTHVLEVGGGGVRSPVDLLPERDPALPLPTETAALPKLFFRTKMGAFASCCRQRDRLAEIHPAFT